MLKCIRNSCVVGARNTVLETFLGHMQVDVLLELKLLEFATPPWSNSLPGRKGAVIPDSRTLLVVIVSSSR